MILCGFTHVVAASLGQDATTILHMLHIYSRREISMFVLDEASMISLATWGLIAQLKYVGNLIVVLGDFGGYLFTNWR